MCGRFAITCAPEAMRCLFGYLEEPRFPPRRNIAPTQPIPIIRAQREGGQVERRFALVRWGFLPGFVKDPKGFPLLFNARSEGLGDKASFRNALRRRRCLVPADAFYLWRQAGREASTPFVCDRADGATMALAALWETWSGPNGEEVDTACIVTTRANGVSAAVHPRLPVVVEAADMSTWLEPDELASEPALTLLRPPQDAVLRLAPIGDAVNNTANDGPDLMAPIGPPLAAGRARPGAQPDLFAGRPS